MNLCACFTVILIKCLYLSAANSNLVKGDGKIVGGHEAKPYSHPYIVSLQTRILYLRMHICGAALINERFILSAAHCSTESWLIRWLPLDAVAGLHDVDNFKSQSQVRRIIDRIPHPLYNGGIGSYDIGLYKTETPFIVTQYVKPIKLSTNYDYKAGEESGNADTLKLAGWGALRTTIFIPDLPARLQEVKVTYIPYEECYNAIEKLKESGESNPLDKDSNICTGPITGGVAACVGDSGGPLVQYKIFPPPNDPVESNTEFYNASSYNCPNDNESTKEMKAKEDSEAFLLGIVSWGVSPCGEIGAPTVYTNVTTFIDFIKYNAEIN
ncbi:granzyme-like protein 1 [Anticarsia gemmatalis]|uniref:granzyme-like protein 1 n=1 Tax=Anticarsia gemmatalis TaxID=129554 RepID=UPI003F7665F3